METTTLSEVMVDDHKVIHGMVNDFKATIDGDVKERSKAFDRLKWKLLQHFALEEKAVFINYRAKNDSDQKEVDDIIAEHKEMVDELENIENDIDIGKKPDIEHFLGKLDSHSIKEDEVLYPKMDMELDDDVREEIVRKIRIGLENIVSSRQ